MSDPDIVLRAGPWQHRMISANGTRIHAALAGPDDGPLVVLLHGFPQCWFAWRHQIPELASAGYRVAALDLRGYGASDKPPGRFDIPVLVDDVAGAIRSLGAASAVVVGHGLGGQVAWSMPALAPGTTRAIASLGAPHPVHLTSVATRVAPAATLRWLARIQVPWFPERAITSGEMVSTVLQRWAAPGWEPEHTDLYTDSMRLPFSAHSAMEQLRWLVRSTPRSDGRAYRAKLREPINVPVLSLHGKEDQYLPPYACRRDHELVAASFQRAVFDGAGHFLPEEAAAGTTKVLTSWLDRLPASGATT